ncbi:MAG: peptidoglycan DD-metalloendopeptidase family protein, partial [Armatimonadetes bacterium]|nr:peptidoglycan DD-metalloendopeptidase family protein [Anaerolineae bacterium]
IQVDPLSRTEAGGYAWWQHPDGWSAERATFGSETLMKEATKNADGTFSVLGVGATAGGTAEQAVDPAKRVELPAHWVGTFALQIAKDVKVRDQPTTDTRATLIKTLKRGLVLQCDLMNKVERDGYYWVKHDQGGWSPIQGIDGKLVFLAEPGTIPGLIAIGPEGPNPKDLPGYGALITKSPVQFDDLQWFQYYGNNVFAYVNGKSYGYDRYSQGLHGGLDYGNSLRASVPVYAGIEGTYVKSEYKKNNNRILIANGDYTFIYQHITNLQSFSPGQVITPDTQLASIEHHSIDNGWDHLHFEIRFMNEWIINPLWLMTPDLLNAMTARFDPLKPNTSWTKTKSTLNCFYKDDVWGDRWTTLLDQPCLQLTGSLLGPRAPK